MLKPSTSMKFSFTVVRLLLGDVEQNAVRVCEMMSAVRAALEEREALLHRLQALHPEADVIRPGPGDAAAVVVEDAPGHEEQGDPAVAQVMVRVAGFPGEPLEAEQVDVELRHLVGVQGAKRQMT